MKNILSLRIVLIVSFLILSFSYNSFASNLDEIYKESQELAKESISWIQNVISLSENNIALTKEKREALIKIQNITGNRYPNIENAFSNAIENYATASNVGKKCLHKIRNIISSDIPSGSYEQKKAFLLSMNVALFESVEEAEKLVGYIENAEKSIELASTLAKNI
jgi:hypothetical protein